MTQIIKHNDLVKLGSWVGCYAKVGTLNGYCPDRAATARERGEPEAWTVQTGAVITSDKSYYTRQEALVASAIVIAHGDIVEIEGNAYRVRVMPRNDGQFPRNSDPIHFIAV